MTFSYLFVTKTCRCFVKLTSIPFINNWQKIIKFDDILYEISKMFAFFWDNPRIPFDNFAIILSIFYSHARFYMSVFAFHTHSMLIYLQVCSSTVIKSSYWDLRLRTHLWKYCTICCPRFCAYDLSSHFYFRKKRQIVSDCIRKRCKLAWKLLESLSA